MTQNPIWLEGYSIDSSCPHLVLTNTLSKGVGSEVEMGGMCGRTSVCVCVCVCVRHAHRHGMALGGTRPPAWGRVDCCQAYPLRGHGRSREAQNPVRSSCLLVACCMPQASH
jgi:hypothetical protein